MYLYISNGVRTTPWVTETYNTHTYKSWELEYYAKKCLSPFPMSVYCLLIVIVAVCHVLVFFQVNRKSLLLSCFTNCLSIQFHFSSHLLFYCYSLKHPQFVLPLEKGVAATSMLRFLFLLSRVFFSRFSHFWSCYEKNQNDSVCFAFCLYSRLKEKKNKYQQLLERKWLFAEDYCDEHSDKSAQVWLVVCVWILFWRWYLRNWKAKQVSALSRAL